MPTNKTPFTFNIDGDYLQKMRYIAKFETRTLSNLLEHICKLYIQQFEAHNGTINIDNEISKDSAK